MWLLLLLLLQTTPAEMRPEARAHLERGLRLYDAHEYAAAVAEFKRGFEIDPRPELLYALGQAERLSGDCKNALESYEKFLRMNPSEAQASSTQKNIERCQAELRAHETAAPPPPASPPPAPPAPALEPKPEAAQVAAPPAGPSREPWYQDRLGDVLAGTGVAALIAGGVLWKMGRDALADANRASDYGTYAARRADAQSGDQLQTIGAAAFLAGGALVTAGVVRYLVRPAPASPQVAAAPTPSGAIITIRARF